MQNRNWLKSNTTQRRLFGGLITSFWLKIKPHIVLGVCFVIWVALALSLTGCAHNSPSQCPELVIPQPPALIEPIPPASYSLRARESFKKWQERLIATPVTP